MWVINESETPFGPPPSVYSVRRVDNNVQHCVRLPNIVWNNRPADSVVSSQDCAENTCESSGFLAAHAKPKSILASSHPATFRTANGLTFFVPEKLIALICSFRREGIPLVCQLATS